MINLHHTDCMEFMRGLPDKAYSLAIVDPPYGISIMTSGGKGAHGWIGHERKEWDANIPDAEYFEQLLRVSDNQIIWGGNYMTKYTHPSMGWVMWDKGQRDFSLADGELAWTSFNRAIRIFSYHRGASNAEQRIHPTQKPVSLYRWLLQNYAKPGDTILDTHGGSMSIAIACDIEGFDLDLCELDKDYFEAGKKRLAEHQAQPRMFDAPKHEQPIQLTIE